MTCTDRGSHISWSIVPFHPPAGQKPRARAADHGRWRRWSQLRVFSRHGQPDRLVTDAALFFLCVCWFLGHVVHWSAKKKKKRRRAPIGKQQQQQQQKRKETFGAWFIVFCFWGRGSLFGVCLNFVFGGMTGCFWGVARLLSLGFGFLSLRRDLLSLKRNLLFVGNDLLSTKKRKKEKKKKKKNEELQYWLK